MLNSHLNKVYEKNKKENPYIFKYISYFYNYEEWFNNRKPRNSKK